MPDAVHGTVSDDFLPKVVSDTTRYHVFIFVIVLGIRREIIYKKTNALSAPGVFLYDVSGASGFGVSLRYWCGA